MTRWSAFCQPPNSYTTSWDSTDWNDQDVIPPVLDVPPEYQHLPEYGSPYLTTLSQVIERFSTTPNRVRLLRGLLAYRRALYDLGITQGFQWLDGSFLENVESKDKPGEERMPHDIDVVTFYYPPDGELPLTDELFTPKATKDKYSVEAYGVPLGEPLDQELVEAISYWHGMWSIRRRDHHAKGFVQIDLDPEYDEHAREALDAKDP